MEKFIRLDAVAAPLLRPNIDTDAIIPSREMKAVSKVGLSGGLFANWRYADVAARTEAPDFVLNKPAFRGAPVLIAGSNFGCGSSREHAVWALQEYGVRCIVAPSFGAIFQGNCVRNGILPVVLPEAEVNALAAAVEADPGVHIQVDLEAQTLTAPDGRVLSFSIPESDKEMLLEGLDLIGVTLKRKDAIDGFESRYRSERPWRRLDLAGADGARLDRALPSEIVA
jgi:3-isopropylmalate/(R)-2-methylmalate dehydratase small subunit